MTASRAVISIVVVRLVLSALQAMVVAPICPLIPP